MTQQNIINDQQNEQERKVKKMSETLTIEIPDLTTIENENVKVIRDVLTRVPPEHRLHQTLANELRTEISDAVINMLKPIFVQLHEGFISTLLECADEAGQAKPGREALQIRVTWDLDGTSVVARWVAVEVNEVGHVHVVARGRKGKRSKPRLRPMINNRDYPDNRSAVLALGIPDEAIVRQTHGGRLIVRYAETLERWCQEHGLDLKWI